MRKWTRDYLLLPVVAGVVVAVFTFALPKFFAKKLELSYEIDRPTQILDEPAVRQVDIEVNGQPVSDLLAFRVRLWNSGDKPIEGLPVQVVFDAETRDFSILNTTHQTTPEYEFGEIAELESTPSKHRFRYELLNPGNEDVVTFLANGTASLKLYTKAAGLKVIQKDKATAAGAVDLLTFPLIALLGALASFLATFLRLVRDKMMHRFLESIRRVLGGGGGG